VEAAPLCRNSAACVQLRVGRFQKGTPATGRSQPREIEFCTRKGGFDPAAIPSPERSGRRDPSTATPPLLAAGSTSEQVATEGVEPCAACEGGAQNRPEPFGWATAALELYYL
jgi:hypothetical protein